MNKRHGIQIGMDGLSNANLRQSLSQKGFSSANLDRGLSSQNVQSTLRPANQSTAPTSQPPSTTPTKTS